MEPKAPKLSPEDDEDDFGFGDLEIISSEEKSNWNRIIIAINDQGNAYYITELDNLGYTFKEHVEQCNRELCLDDLGMSNLPQEVGVYECVISSTTSRDYSGEVESIEKVVSFKKLFGL